jgi:hypothetical protein
MMAVAVPVQADGYARTDTWAMYNGTLGSDLVSFTVCHRLVTRFYTGNNNS